MKKYLCIFLTIVMALGLAACKTDSGDAKDSTGVVGMTNGKSDATTLPPAVNTTSPALSYEGYVVKAPGCSVYVNYTQPWQVKEEPTTSIIFGSNDCLVGFCHNAYVDFSGELDEVFDVFRSDFLLDTDRTSRGDFIDSELQLLSQENCKMNGYDSIRFTGIAPNDDGWDCHVYGYAFVIDGIPCAVIGLVSAQSQDPAMLAEIDTAVDEIASTIRTTE